MNTAKRVDELVAQWKQEGLSKPELVVNAAKASIGWPYVFGARGELCTTAKRKTYLGYHPDKVEIKNKCQVLNGSKETCDGCMYYPSNERTRIFDCRGFTYWLLTLVDIKLNGGGATTQWEDKANWEARGDISDLPQDKVCCVFKRVDGKMSHTGMHIGGGQIIHCSGTVKRGKVTTNGWSHYAIPKGLGDPVNVPIVETMIEVSNDYPTLRRGSKGAYVTLAQTELIKRSYNLGSYGADGTFGRITEDAVRRFQADWGLTVDGVIGRKTWAYLLTPQEEKFVTLIIPGLTNEQATVLMEIYPKAFISDSKEA